MLKDERWIVGAIVLCFLALIIVPFLIASSLPDQDHVFAGFLANPIDGNSYLAKMRQGYEGSWLFTLPYTAEPGEGTALHFYYLFLGHLARTLNLPILVVFHIARVLGALALALSLYSLFKRLFDEIKSRLIALALALFGSGLGWLVIWSGVLSSDFWVAEAFPFLASFTNAHFPLGLALQVYLLTQSFSAERMNLRALTVPFIASFLLSVIFLFGWVVCVVVIGVQVIWNWWGTRKLGSDLVRWLLVTAGGAPFALYSLWVASVHPVLSEWNAQNLSPSPGLLNLLISLFPILLMALVGVYFALNHRAERLKIIVIWLVIGIAIIYIPVSLQRRLMSGLLIPAAALAAYALSQLKLRTAMQRWAVYGLLALALPTNAFIILGSLQAVREQQPSFVIAKAELAAFEWLDTHGGSDHPLVLSSPGSGLFLPVYASVGVVYGHPAESAQADLRRQEAIAFFSGTWGDNERMAYLDQMGVDYLFYGPPEQALGPNPALPDWVIVYDLGGVQIWEPGDDQ